MKAIRKHRAVLIMLGVFLCIGTSCSSSTSQSNSGSIFSKKEAIITPVSEFSGGLAVVERDGKYGYIDTSGKVVIPIQYIQAAPFQDGAALVTVALGGGESHQAYIDATGEIVFDFRKYAELYDDIFPYNEGLLGVSKKVESFYANEVQYGFIDLYGNTVMPLQGQWQVDKETIYKNGFVWLAKLPEQTNTFINDETFRYGQLYTFGAFNKAGRHVYTCSFEDNTAASGGVESTVAVDCKIIGGCAALSQFGIFDSSTYKMPMQYSSAYRVYHPAIGEVFSNVYSQSSILPPTVVFEKALAGNQILFRTNTTEQGGKSKTQYRLIDTSVNFLPCLVDIGGSENQLIDVYGFYEGLSAIEVMSPDGLIYSYYVNMMGNPSLHPQTEYFVGDFSDGYAIWRKTGENDQSYAYIYDLNSQKKSEPIPFDGDLSQRLRFHNGYCLLTQNGTAKFIDTQGQELMIQDYQEGQKPIQLTEEMRIPDLSTAIQTPIPTPLLPSASPNPDEGEPSIDETKSDETAEYMDQLGNTALEEYIEELANGMYFVNQVTGYVAYVKDVWDGAGSIFVNGQEVIQFDFYEYVHHEEDAYVDFANPPNQGNGIHYYYEKKWIVFGGEFEGKEFNGIYDYVEDEPPIPSNNIWGDYSTPWLDEMFDGMGDDYE